MGCGCGKKRASKPLAATNLRQASASASSIVYVLVDSGGAEISKHEDLLQARNEWTRYRQSTDSGARLLQRTISY